MKPPYEGILEGEAGERIYISTPQRRRWVGRFANIGPREGALRRFLEKGKLRDRRGTRKRNITEGRITRCVAYGQGPAGRLDKKGRFFGGRESLGKAMGPEPSAQGGKNLRGHIGRNGEKKGRPNFWAAGGAIGVAFVHKDGEGYRGARKVRREGKRRQGGPC